ncbi:fimbrial protein [Salmonella enterica subsp. diarizonae]|nr:fimbrial protein [Salmonella enterica subsp. diarizonae]
MNLCLLLATPAFAVLTPTTTVTSEFVITNRTIENAEFKSTASGFSSENSNGNGLYKMSDNFSDANVNNLLLTGGNHQIGLKRVGSLFEVEMKGEKLGHKFKVKGKYANSRFHVDSAAKRAFGEVYKNDGGCTTVTPSDVPYLDTKPVSYEITSNNNVQADCKGTTYDVGYSATPPLKSAGLSRDVYLDLSLLQKDKAYRDAPPDTYTGTNTYSGEAITNRWSGPSVKIYYINKIKIIKNPYFENVTLPTGDNIFTVKTVGSNVRGELVIPYVINGHFTPYNRITLNVTSLNNFKLKSMDSHEIPYSLTTGIGSQKEYSLVTSGTSHAPVTITNLTNENYALQGRFNANFSIAKSAVNVGDYTDTLTAIFEIALE